MYIRRKNLRQSNKLLVSKLKITTLGHLGISMNWGIGRDMQ